MVALSYLDLNESDIKSDINSEFLIYLWNEDYCWCSKLFFPVVLVQFAELHETLKHNNH